MSDDDEKKQPPQEGMPNEEKPSIDEYLMGINQQFKEEEIKEKAKKIGVPYVQVGTAAINPDVMEFVDREEAEKGKMMPFLQLARKIHMAVANPDNSVVKEVVDNLQDKGYEAHLFLSSEEGIKQAQQLYYSSHYIEKKKKKEEEEVAPEKKKLSVEEEIKNLADLKEKIRKVPIDETMRLIQIGAASISTSDIHFQPEEKNAKVRFRIDGVLTDVLEMPLDHFEQVVKQIKYLSRLKLNITNFPQDGQYKFELEAREVDVRVSTLPTQYGETVVLRLLDPKKAFLSLQELGFNDTNLDRIKKALRNPNGLILVTGPTGSGKTTTLYSMLNILNTTDKKIITLEDPIEYHLHGISQSQVDTNVDYDFGTGLRAILRQDPDVLMVGEIRDLITAETAAQSALTGHIVLSTLHTNSAVESITRLIDMGMQPFIIAPALNIVIAQRLLRTVCTCAMEREPKKSEKQQVMKVINDIKGRGIKMPELKVVKSPVGCDLCSKTGYRGQTVVSEVMEIDDDIREMMLAGAHTQDILKKMKEKGMLTMREDGVMKVLAGVTTVSEVWRVT